MSMDSLFEESYYGCTESVQVAVARLREMNERSGDLDAYHLYRESLKDVQVERNLAFLQASELIYSLV